MVAKRRRRVSYGLQRAVAELSVLDFARDLDEVIKLHKVVAAERRAIAKHQRRKRSERELEILSLARVLEMLARQYKSFDGEIRKLQYYVRKQLTPPKVRRAELMAKVADSDGLDLSDLLQSTLHPAPVVRSDIRALVKAGRIVEVNRHGGPPRRRTAEGRAVERIIFKAAVPSQAKARRG